MRRVRTIHTRHQSLEIWKSEQATEMRVAGAIHAWHHRSRFLCGLAWDLIAAGALLGREKPRSILMLGLAGGTSLRILRHLLPDCRFTAIDIDPEIVGAARRYMDLDKLGIEVIFDDAYQWLKGNRRRFDVVIDDVYLAGRTDVHRPQAPVDPSLLPRLRRAMEPDGVLVVNLVIGPGHRRMQTLTRACLKDAFPMLRTVRSPHALNEVLVAGKHVHSLSRLDPSAFQHPRDRAYWRDLNQRLL
ncbi:MAG TPA: hypothetical protein VFY13_06950 [Luteolibacter sp.]|nr:hypothetical protein [Luteolibacter sp.]